MKKILILMSCAALLFCGCKDDEDNQAKVSREYQTRIGLGQDGYLGSETNNLNQLNTLLEEGIANINKQFGAKFTINATGDTEEEAYAQCDAQAKQKYEEQSASIKAALVYKLHSTRKKQNYCLRLPKTRKISITSTTSRTGWCLIKKASRSLQDTKTSTSWKTLPTK